MTELIVNGEFETGDFTGWTIVNGSPIVGAGYKRSGNYGCQCELDVDGVGYGDYIRQENIDWISISPIELVFWFNMRSTLEGADNLQMLNVVNVDLYRLFEGIINAGNVLSISNGQGGSHNFNFNPNEWTYVKIIYTDNSTAIQITVNSTSETIAPASYSGGIYRISIGALYTGGQPTKPSKEIWFDDVSMSNGNGILPPICPENPYQLLINGIERNYIKVHYVKNHPDPDPDTFDVTVNYDVGELVNYFDSVEVRKNGVTEFYGFVEDINPQKGLDGLEYLITGRCWKLILWKKQTERFMETREVGVAEETGFFGKVYPQELIMFLLRTPISVHPSGKIRHKIGWGIPSDWWKCDAIRTATGHHPQWVALRETGFSWQLGAYHYVDNQEVNSYTEDMRQWITSDDTIDAVNTNLPVDAWVFVHNDFTHVNTEPWLHDDDEVNYIHISAESGNIGKYDEHYTFSNLTYDHIYTTAVNLYVKGKLYDGVGGHATSVTVKFYVWDGTQWWSGSWAFTSTEWELIPFNFSILNTIAKINGAKLKIEFEAVVDGGADKGGIKITYTYLHVEGTGITWENANSPWLGVSDENYIEGRIDGTTTNSYMSYFDFEDVPTPTNGWRDHTIGTVDLKLVGKNVIIGGVGRQVYVRVYLWDGSVWVDTGTDFSWTTGETVWTTKTLDVSSILDTIAKINSARLKLYFIGTGVGTEPDVSYVRITQAFLTVEITESSYQRVDDWFKIDLDNAGETEYDRVTAILIENRNDVTESRMARHFEIQVSSDNFAADIRTVYVKLYNNARDILASWKPEDNVRYIRIVILGDYDVGWEISQIYVWQAEELKYRLLNE